MDTDFYMAGGLAFLLAMLGWSDQIRGKQETTRLLESKLLDQFRFQWSELQPFIRPDRAGDPAQRLKTVVGILRAGRLTTGDQTSVFRLLTNANRIRTKMEARYRARFMLVFIMSVEMIVAGIFSIYQKGPITIFIPSYLNFWSIAKFDITLNFGFTWPVFWQVLSIGLIAALLYATLRLNFDEQNFRECIDEISDLLSKNQDRIPKETEKPVTNDTDGNE